MNWTGITSVYLLATFKFMFAPFTGSVIGLTFFETYFSAVAGGSFGAAVFYFSSELMLSYTHKKRILKNEQLLEKGLPIPLRKKFTRTNRLILQLKRKLGIIGICFWAPFFLSVPVGSIIAAKFYGSHKMTYPLIVIGMFLNALITTILAYFIF